MTDKQDDAVETAPEPVDYNDVTYKLLKPVGDVTELTFTEATLGAVVAAEKAETDMGRVVILWAHMASVEVEVIEGLSGRDTAAIMDAVEHLMGN